MIEALKAAYLAGFNASGEGYNGEYPYGDRGQNAEDDAVWCKDRENYVNQALAEQQEPWAWLFQHEETGLTQCVDTQQVEWGFEKNNPRWQKIAPLYTTPQAQPATVQTSAKGGS